MPGFVGSLVACGAILAAVAIRATWHRLFEWAAARRDATVTRALEQAPPGPIDRDLADLLRESVD